MMRNKESVFWLKSGLVDKKDMISAEITPGDVKNTQQEWQLLARPLGELFSELKKTGGIIDSPLKLADELQTVFAKKHDFPTSAKVLLKEDNLLPVAGSIKARGGIFAVCKLAIGLAEEEGILLGNNYAKLTAREVRQFFSDYSLEVASTGNLGLSVGLTGRALGFQVKVHMSRDARNWKKELLRKEGAKVIEYEGDYGEAISTSRELANQQEKSIFIDDENSPLLFLGYSTAAFYLAQQLKGIEKDFSNSSAPIFVYLPCGVGGAPGGIAYGLKYIFGRRVFPIIVEPVTCPAVTEALIAEYCQGEEEKNELLARIKKGKSDHDTLADGLAVRKPSKLVLNNAGNLFAGAMTIAEKDILSSLKLLADISNVRVEPSAAAGVLGPIRLKQYLNKIPGSKMIDSFARNLVDSYHIIWLTGGKLLPEKEWQQYYQQANSYLQE